MFPPPQNEADDDARFLTVFRADTGGAPTSFAEFMELALYHPELGYYRRQRQRVGFAPDADFYTATSTGTVFGELVAAAATKLLKPAAPDDFAFVEIGAEPGGGVLDGMPHPFGSRRTSRLGDTPELAGDIVVFSNELFDAQPFHRVVFQYGSWRELGVALQGDTFVEVELPELTRAVAAASERLPATTVEGYRIDLPLAAASLCARLVEPPWHGVFIAFDYGQSWSELTTSKPDGTARAYREHRQVRDLLAAPGRQDITCHICWDWLADELATAGFRDIHVESQEAFLIRHAGETAARIAQGAMPGPDPRRSRLHELLHPGLLGQRFQVLHAIR
jgi:SAM-dependent MidA family methyltransferase